MNDMADSMPKVTLINKSDSTGGAAVVSFRLLEALLQAGVDACMIVEEKLSDNPFVVEAASSTGRMIPFLEERLEIFAANGFRRDSLFRIDTASHGLPLHRHPFVREADIICLNWVNQGMLSLKGVKRILDLGKPVVWTMHDMWNFTGVCHHAGSCLRYMENCGDCPLIGFPRGTHDMSARIFKRKAHLYEWAVTSQESSRLTFVAVSNWLASLARKSPLLGGMPVEVIPNAFPVSDFPHPDDILQWRQSAPDRKPGEFTVAIGAARLDDPVKGLPLLLEAFAILRESYPDLASRTRLLSFGSLRDSKAFDSVAVSHTHLGPLAGSKQVMEVLRSSDAVVSSSLYETLPGTLVEAQACGAVPVSFDRGGQADIINHGVTGYLAHISDDTTFSARNLAEGIAWAAQQAEESVAPLMARSVADKFSAAAIASRYINLFRRLPHS